MAEAGDVLKDFVHFLHIDRDDPDRLRRSVEWAAQYMSGPMGEWLGQVAEAYIRGDPEWLTDDGYSEGLIHPLLSGLDGDVSDAWFEEAARARPFTIRTVET